MGMKNNWLLLTVFAFSLFGQPFLAEPCRAFESISIFKKKKKEKKETVSDYKKLTGRDSVELKGLMNVIQKDGDFYLEIPRHLFGRAFLVSNKLLRVPKELNEAGVNRGVNYENQVIRFEWNKRAKLVNIRQQRLFPEVDSNDAMAASVKDNYIDPLIAALKTEAVAPDSSTVVVKVNDLFNGKETFLNDVFNLINLGTSAEKDLSHILSLRSFDNSVVAVSELSTIVREDKSKANITVVVNTGIRLLPEKPMAGREENAKVGFFTTDRLVYSDTQSEVTSRRYITRWRLEPSDSAAYMAGKLVEPKKPIVFYLDKAVPRGLRPYIKKGITDWNKAFEKAGFKNAVRVGDLTDSIMERGDDMDLSVINYDASTKANAMGPSVIDPRTGEILKADIIWWHNVRALLKEWFVVQTAPYNPIARKAVLPDSVWGDAARFVACHEVGHSLGLRHNMRASNAYPTDSLRSAAFLKRVGGTSSSIMDYARYNYVAQPEDKTPVASPHVGPYDMMAIEWAYRWYPDESKVKPALQAFLDRHKGPLYAYSESQDQRNAVDPRALIEDVGDDVIKSAEYGIKNLKRIVPNIVSWTTTGEPGQDYDEAAKLYSGVIYQWNLYLYHVLANVGGMYLGNATVADGEPNFRFVEKKRQEQATRFLLKEVLSDQPWLFDSPLGKYTFVHRKTPNGIQEQLPILSLYNQQSYILWDLLDNRRIARMSENERLNGNNAFTPVMLMDMLHKHIFSTTISGKMPGVSQRTLQKLYVDALITAANEGEGVKINKHLRSEVVPSQGMDIAASCRQLTSSPRDITFTGKQATRTGDALSVKRGELLRIVRLLRTRRNKSTVAVRAHYDDIIMRINTALGLNK